eukprot:TRINITY_DN8463_c0_g1_i11.p1 TRINITY_DN8463_c0_g1~~TRINITY_DN8463_c0_g1_i11.p1  ORF type:complete len:419 (-),score=82.97 TRINITY_DN8463_c0_g1_i11:598-1854(-)
MERYDLVVYGASGFTGQYVVEYVHRAALETGVTWAVAGRNESKLLQVLNQASEVVGADLKETPKIICDCSDTESLSRMARQARVVLNCVGPYRFFGEMVVEACVENGAHHVDISGEPGYLEKMQLNYHAKAVDNEVYVVGACGFDSIPADLGQTCVKKEMKGDVNSIETFLNVTIPPLPGAAINFGTWQSAIHGFANSRDLAGIRRALYPEKLPTPKYKLKPRGNMFHCNEMDSYAMPFLGSDRSVMMRSQRGFYHEKDEHPSQIQCYVLMRWWNCILTIFMGMIFGFLASYKFGRSLLENHPKFFSFGAVSKQGVPKQKAAETNFELTLFGKGWATKGDHDSPPNRVVKTVVKGKNVGYGSTCECMVQAGLVLLFEPDRLPGVGGVYPPGFAFAETTLVSRLNKHDVTFESSVVTSE